MFNDKGNMMHTPAMRIVGKILWLLVTIGAINWGLDVLGYNLFNLNFVQMNMPMIVQPLKVIIGLAGVLSLVHLIMHCTSDHCTSC